MNLNASGDLPTFQLVPQAVSHLSSDKSQPRLDRLVKFGLIIYGVHSVSPNDFDDPLTFPTGENINFTVL